MTHVLIVTAAVAAAPFVVLWGISLVVANASIVDLFWGPSFAMVAWAVGMYFETVGDLQLRRFKADLANEGLVMDQGLWRYTRHPNYFGGAKTCPGSYHVPAWLQAGT
ncbi:MAG: hypothetical protein A2Z12_07010 [Actinobacteria bacterium RBG_16_68_21]|nr:MAG: hypothetical protein A2Z12_07010 [Actinobacteria bacterium RBG_16_68_21]